MKKIFRKLFCFTDKQRRTALQKLEILGYNDPKNLTKRELMIASNLVDPEKITVSYESIGGLDYIIDDIKKNVIIPAYKKKYKKELVTNLTNIQKRILLYGPRGCGKTMISEAIAKEKGIYCLKLDARLSLFSGHLASYDRNYKKNIKLIDALFSLARKLQPFIIFIDCFENLDWSLYTKYKMTVVDYFVDKLLHTENDLIIIGETNRFLYRKHLLFNQIVQRGYHIALPNTNQRRDILASLVKTYGFVRVRCQKSLHNLAIKTFGFSGYDLDAIFSILIDHDKHWSKVTMDDLFATVDKMIKHNRKSKNINTVSDGYFALKKIFLCLIDICYHVEVQVLFYICKKL